MREFLNLEHTVSTLTVFSPIIQGSFSYAPIAHHTDFKIGVCWALQCYHLPITPLRCWLVFGTQTQTINCCLLVSVQ